jgi:hypothetical protein
MFVVPNSFLYIGARVQELQAYGCPWLRSEKGVVIASNLIADEGHIAE